MTYISVFVVIVALGFVYYSAHGDLSDTSDSTDEHTTTWTENGEENLTSSTGLGRSEILKLRKCGFRDMCTKSGNFSDPWFEARIKNNLSFQLEPDACRCDEENVCMEYGDCCVTIVNKPIKKNPWRCSHLQSRTWALMINSCSPTNEDKDLEKLCTMESIVTSKHTYRLDLPIYNKDGKFYRNINCAMCNGNILDKVNPLKIRILCNQNLSDTFVQDFMKEALYTPRERYWKHYDTYCGIYIPEFDALRINTTNPLTRYCSQEVTDYCPPGTEEGLSQLCSSYVQHVTIKDKTLFKNPHCAECHGINITVKNTLKCFLKITPPTTVVADIIKGPNHISLIYDHTNQLKNLLQKFDDPMDGHFLVAKGNIAKANGFMLTVFSITFIIIPCYSW